MTVRPCVAPFVFALFVPFTAFAQIPNLAPDSPRLAAFALDPPVATDPPAPAAEPPPPPRSWRAALEQRGVVFATSSISDWSGVAGVDAKQRPVARTLFDVSATLDLEQMAGVRGSSVFVQYYAKVGSDGSTRMTTVQGYSNIDAPSFSRIGEVWFEQRLAGERLRLKTGRIDANTEFAAVEAAADFLNPALGGSPTILMFPSYPDPRFGAVAAFDANAHFGVSVGGFRGEDDVCAHVSPERAHRFVVGELRTRWTLAGSDGRASLGVWHHTGHLASDPSVSIGSDHYATLEQTVWQGSGADHTPKVTLFAQYGSAAGDEIDRHVSAGVTWQAPHASRPDDIVGAALTAARLPVSSDHERTLALFYRYSVAPWLAFQPDVQVIRHPGGEDRPSAIAATFRMQFGF